MKINLVKKYVRQAKSGPYTLTRWRATNQESYAALLADEQWREVAAGEPSKLPPNLPAQTASSDRYDAYKFVGDCPDGGGVLSAYTGMAVYVYAIPGAARTADGGNPTKITKLEIDALADKFLRSGGVVSVVLNGTTSHGLPVVPDAVISSAQPYAGLATTGAVLADANAGKVAATNKAEKVTIYNNETGLALTSWDQYLFVVVQLDDYLDYNFEYWIEGGFAVRADTLDVTFAHTVTADAEPASSVDALHTQDAFPADTGLTDNIWEGEGQPTAGDRDWKWSEFEYIATSEAGAFKGLYDPQFANPETDFNLRIMLDRMMRATPVGGEYFYGTANGATVTDVSNASIAMTGTPQALRYLALRASAKSMTHAFPSGFTPQRMVCHITAPASPARFIVLKDTRVDGQLFANNPLQEAGGLTRLREWFYGRAVTGDDVAGLTIAGQLVTSDNPPAGRVDIPLTATLSGTGNLWLVVIPLGVRGWDFDKNQWSAKNHGEVKVGSRRIWFED